MSGPLPSLHSITGYMPAVPTPFDESGAVDHDALRRFCEWQIRKGASALVVCGTTGESASLTDKEQYEVIEAAVKTAKKRVPVIAGAGSNSTKHAIELSQSAQEAGADALLSVVPYYNKPSQTGLHDHFMAILETVTLPTILYDVPSRSACGLSDATIERIAKHRWCIGLKDATGDVTRPSRLRPLLKREFRLLSGDDASALGFFAYGGDGCISVTSNVAPGLCQSMHLAFRHGQLAFAQHLASIVGEITSALFTESNPIVTKYALSLLGLMSPTLRLPLTEPCEKSKKLVADVLSRRFGEYKNCFVGSLSRPPMNTVQTSAA